MSARAYPANAMMVVAALILAEPCGAKPTYTILPAGTAAHGINASGAVTGDESDGSAFLRTPDGTITKFRGPRDTGGLSARSINIDDSITGHYYDYSKSTYRGFVRTADGTITAFDAPGASQGTFARSINSSGSIAGYYVGDTGVPHGFVRTPDGTITSIDIAQALETWAVSVNDQGAVVGYLYDTSYHGFLRTAQGEITTIDVPGKLYTFATSINTQGTITGYWFSGNGYYGFIRTVDGRFKVFDSIDLPVGINDKGLVAGEAFHKARNGYRTIGFVRKNNGNFDTFHISRVRHGLAVEGINAEGAIVGYFQVRDAGTKKQFTFYGFIRTP